MTTWELFVSAWDWEPSVIVGCATLAVAWLLPARPRSPGRGSFFFGGVILLLLDLISPIDLLGDRYLFSAHALQHFLLMLVIPPLLVLGTPRVLVDRALRYPWIAAIERVLSKPAVAWPIGVVPMIAWHLPALFDAALSSEALHIFQHLTFLISGTIFWWPIVGPLPERRPGPLGSIAYLFSACTACSILGAAITFTPLGAYAPYANVGTNDEIARLIRTGWGLDSRSDQQLGGMLMWVPGCLVYLTAILASVARWFAAGHAEATQ
jgi:cytochrome c oxidase assembly factor CtaG